MKKFLLLVLIFSGFIGLTAQTINFQPQSNHTRTAHLDKKFKDYTCFSIDPNQLRLELQETNSPYYEFTVAIGDINRTYGLFEYEMFSANTVSNDGHTKTKGKLPYNIRTYRGYNLNNSTEDIALTVADDYMLLMFRYEDQNYYFEQDLAVGLSDYILYKESDVNPIPGISCGADIVKNKHSELEAKHQHELQSRNRGCRELEVGLTCDFSYVSLHRNQAGAAAAMAGILNLVQLDFARNFYVDINLFIAEIVTPPDAMQDPFRNINDIITQLNTFNLVANQIFSVPFDIASCWSARYTTGIVGVAWLNAVCGPFPLNICSEFTSSSNMLRQLQSHEWGHNFSAVHDANGSPYIMAPVVNGSNVWSGGSIFSINTWIGGNGGCMAECAGSEIPNADFSADPQFGCAPLVVQFKNLSSNSNAWKWQFPGGTPSTSTAQHPTVTYTKSGFYDITLESINPRCSTKITKTTFIEVIDKPVPDFDYGFTDRHVGFLNFSQNGETYFWDFGDGATDTDENPYHDYAKDGTYTVTLKVTNQCGTVTITKKIEIYSFPVVEFTSDTTGGCAAKTIKFFEMCSDNVTRWQWTFKGGKPSASFDKNPVVTYPNAGSYDVELRVYTAKYNTALLRKTYIVIDSAPIANFVYNANGGKVDFTDQSIYPKTYNWNFGDGASSTEANPTHNYLDGTYEVTLDVDNACGHHQIKRTINVGGQLLAAFEAKNPKGCAPYSITFDNLSSSSALTYKWYFPGGNPSTSTLKNPTVTYNTAGKYNVSLVVYNATSQDSITKLDYIDMQEFPKAAFQSSVQGLKVFLTDQSHAGDKYEWDFGNGKKSSEMSPTIDYGQEGEFLIKLTITNDCGSSTVEKRVAVYLVPKVNFIADTIRGCAPLTVHYKDLSSIDVIDWNWQFEGGAPTNSTTQNPSVTYTKAGSYTVKLTVKNTNGTNASTKVKYIEIYSPIDCPKIKQKRRKADPGGGENFIELDSRYMESSIDIYPNPIRDILFINYFSEIEQTADLQILSLTGQLMKKQTIHAGVNEIPTNGLAAGSYLIKISNVEMNELHKIMLVD